MSTTLLCAPRDFYTLRRPCLHIFQKTQVCECTYSEVPNTSDTFFILFWDFFLLTWPY